MPDKMIRVPEGLLFQLEQEKGKKSHADYILAMLTFFKVNNINPYSIQEVPAKVILEKLDAIAEKLGGKIERHITISKAQEKDYFKLIPDILRNGVGVARTEVVEAISATTDDMYVGNALTVEELTILTDDNEKKSQRIEELETNLRDAELERDKWKLKAEQGGNDVKGTVIRQCVEALESKAQSVRLAEGFLQIPKDEFRAIIGRIKDAVQ